MSLWVLYITKRSSIKKSVDENHDKLDSLIKLQDHMKKLQTENDKLKGRLQVVDDSLNVLREGMMKEIKSMQASSWSHEITIEKLKCENRRMNEAIHLEEIYWRRNKMRFLCIPEGRNEHCEIECIILIICENAGLYFDRGTFVRVHRVGHFSWNRAQSIIEGFHHYKDRDLGWECRIMICSWEQIPISEDYPAVIAEHRRGLFPIMSAA